MRSFASLLAVALLGLLGCQEGNEAASVEQGTATVVVTTRPTPTPTPTESAPTPKEEVLRSITSCDVREVVFGHGAVAYIKYRGGERGQVQLSEAAADELFLVAQQQRCPGFERIIVAIE